VTLARILELGRAHFTVEEIDQMLHREGLQTSTGTLWRKDNDGCVVVRTLLNNSITPVSGVPAITRYIATRKRPSNT
jgi:hypothetical protein